jgi:hypothetical protein
MTASLTERLQQQRLVVVEVDGERRRLRVRGEGCTDLSCHHDTIVVTEDGTAAGIEALYPGDVVRLETDVTDAGALVARVVVLRRTWEGLASPEL